MVLDFVDGGVKMQIMCKLLFLIGLTAATVALGCGGRITIPELDTGPTPTVPASYVTFTDPVGLFSISYPPDWEEKLQLLDEGGQDVATLLESIPEYRELGSDFGLLFKVAGRPTGTPYLDPEVQMGIRPSPGSDLAQQEFIHHLNQLNENARERVHEISKILVDGREALLAYWEVGGLPSVRQIDLQILDGNILWELHCWTFSRDKENVGTCKPVLRSFRILQ